MFKFDNVSAAKFNNSLARVSSNTDLEVIAHGAIIQLSEDNRNSDRLDKILSTLVIASGKPSAACKQVTSYLKAQGLKYSTNSKTQKIKVKTWVNLEEAVTFSDWLAQEKPKSKATEKTPAEKILNVIKKMEFVEAIEALEDAKTLLLLHLQAEAEKKGEAVEFDGLTSTIEGEKITIAQ